jgi:hypothetical protein
MATNNRGRSAGGDRGRGGRNNNPEGRNQYSGVMGKARENPLATAAVVGGAAAAGVFLWSRRNEIGDQLGNLAGQISEWRAGMTSDSGMAADQTSSGETFATTSGMATSGSSRRTQAEIAEEALTLKVTGEAV